MFKLFYSYYTKTCLSSSHAVYIHWYSSNYDWIYPPLNMLHVGLESRPIIDQWVWGFPFELPRFYWYHYIYLYPFKIIFCGVENNLDRAQWAPPFWYLNVNKNKQRCQKIYSGPLGYRLTLIFGVFYSKLLVIVYCSSM